VGDTVGGDVKVRSITLREFMSHIASKVELPDHGVVLVTGPNGAGKSSLIEAVAVACWGKSLRGTSPWRPGVDGTVTVEADTSLVVDRGRLNDRGILWWSLHGHAEKFESATKAQAALEHVVGTLDLWRRTHVFSSADAAHFTMATDGERKRLLEAMLGLDRFDDALDQCRADLKKAVSEHHNLENAVELLLLSQAAQHRRRDEARTHLNELHEPGDVAALQADLLNLERLIRVYDGDYAGLRKRLREADAAAARADADAEHAKCALDGFKGGKCPTCHETLPRLRYKDLQDRARVAEVSAIKVRQTTSQARADVESDARSLEEEQAALARKRHDVAAQVSAARAMETTRKSLQAVLDSADKDLDHIAKQLASGDLSRMEAAKTVGELEAVERVLGLKGVRAHVLSRTLGGLQFCANAWLARIAGPDLRLKLQAYSEKKSGGVSDAIGLEVEGAGGGHGYRAASGGERRRIDVALLMALAEVAQAAHGQSSGTTLFFDEVFDALDPAGVDAVARALDDLGQTRTVVVISHSDDLAERLTPALRLRVTPGGVLT
jgi:DNA repair exonuclease SbcCD ATPase subunit